VTIKSGQRKQDGKKQAEPLWTLSSQLLDPTLLGQKFGDYVIISQNKWRRNSRTYVEVYCPHGTDRVLLDNLKRGQQLGCKQCYLERNNLPNFRSDEERALYYRVHSVILRCTNRITRGYESYGGRNISVYPEWMDNPYNMVKYLMSLDGYSLDKTIDRIDVDKNYEPGNLQWATIREQARNKRNSVYVIYKNREVFFEDFVREYTDLSLSRARELLHKGWTAEQLAEWEPLPRGNRVRFAKLRT
jgi:hypothetical protein